MGTEIKAIIFDYGGVFTPSPFLAAHAYAETQGVEPEKMVATVFGDYHEDNDHPWHQLERGEVDLTTALAGIGERADRLGINFDAAELFGAMRDDGIDRTVVVDYVRGLRQRGLQTAILTNNIAEYSHVWRAQIPVGELFDAVIDSCEEKMRKPDPAIYWRALSRLDIKNPSAAVFLDDFVPNVEAAQAIGMHGVVVHPDPRPALAQVDKLLAN